MKYDILYDYATKNHVSFNQLCSLVKEAASNELYELEEGMREIVQLNKRNQALVKDLKDSKPRRPLQASLIVTLYPECPTSDEDMVAFAREIEQLHGIK